MSPPRTGRLALKHRGGVPVFSEQWHAEVVAVVDLLIAERKINPEEWSQALGEQLELRATAHDADSDQRYYNAFLSALEQLLDRCQFAVQAEVDKRENDWRKAYLRTPHGKPVLLKD